MHGLSVTAHHTELASLPSARVH